MATAMRLRAAHRGVTFVTLAGVMLSGEGILRGGMAAEGSTSVLELRNEARTLESENLNRELQAALEALELSSTVLEDSALMSPRSGLPNRRYLDIWLRSTLFMARRRREPMALALWSQPLIAGTKGRLTKVATHLRGEDLLVELSSDQYLLLLPHTTDAAAELLLGRIRETLGNHPTGATVWLPDGKDMTMKSALRRVAKAFTDANRERSALVWSHG